LEVCLKEIEQGADVDTVLFRYPELADELRPILDASIKARKLSVPAPSQDVVRRNRAKLLQHAAEMREAKATHASRRIWSVPLRRALVSLMVIAVLFVSSTGLVRASSNTLPGDNLYPVKRTWEDVILFFTFNPDQRQSLELEHENERLDELHELFAEGRSAEVGFAGYVTRQTGTEWRVSGITVFISSSTLLPVQPVAIGAPVRVNGRIQNGGVIAAQIELLPSDSKLPEVNDDGLEIEGEDHEDAAPEVEDESDIRSVVEPTVVPTVISSIKTPTPTIEPEDVTVEGKVTSIQNNLIVINGIVMDIQFAEEIKGIPSAGITAKVEGYYDAGGIFIVTKIEFNNTSINSGSSNNNTNDDDSHDDDNSNSNDDDSHDDNNNNGSDD
jgi:hypothetical protein